MVAFLVCLADYGFLLVENVLKISSSQATVTLHIATIPENMAQLSDEMTKASPNSCKCAGNSRSSFGHC